MTTFIQITFALAILALVIFITMMLASSYYHFKSKRERGVLHNTINSVVKYGDINDEEYWKTFKPGECIVFNGYLAKDDYSLTFFNRKPKRRCNENGSVYFSVPGDCVDEDLPSFMQSELSLTKFDEVRKVCIKVVVSSGITEVENENT